MTVKLYANVSAVTDADLSSNPGAAAKVLQTDAGGLLQLAGLGIGAAPAAGNVVHSGDLVSYKGSTGYAGYAFVPLPTKLTSSSFDGDAFGTTAKTVIDLSAAFGVPAGIKAVLVRLTARDSASAAGVPNPYVMLGPNDTSGDGFALWLGGEPDDKLRDACLTVPCNADGDIYYQCTATGSGTLDIWIQIWGYFI